MNLVTIIIDYLRADHVGINGNPWIKTPHMDALGRESVRFTRAFPESLPTVQVRKALHTGIRTFPNRNWTPYKPAPTPGWTPLPESDVTMAEILQGKGYRTALMTDLYHMFRPGMNFIRGFDEWRFVRRAGIRRVSHMTAERRADVELALDGGERYRIGEVTVSQDVIAPELVADLIPFARGDAYRADLVSRLQQNLNSSGYFGQLAVVAEPATATRTVPGQIEVAPLERRWAYGVGVGYATDTGMRLRADVANPHVNRRGHRLDVKGLTSPVRTDLEAAVPHSPHRSAEGLVRAQCRRRARGHGNADQRHLPTGPGRACCRPRYHELRRLRRNRQSWAAPTG